MENDELARQLSARQDVSILFINRELDALQKRIEKLEGKVNAILIKIAFIAGGVSVGGFLLTEFIRKHLKFWFE